MNTLSDTVSCTQNQLYRLSEISYENVFLAIESATQDNPVIVDFDETLFLRNSTQAYLESIYTRPLGMLFLLVVKALKPWRFLPAPLNRKDVSRDWFLVMGATILFPWTLLVWQKRAESLAQQYCNRPLAQTIDANAQPPVVIATLGFGFIVNPLIRHLPMSSVKTNRVQIIACRFWQGILDRAAGKLKMVRAVLDERSVSQSIVVTDSDTDQPLLDVVAAPCLLTWPDARFVPAMSDLYVPLFYSEKVKNPGKAHFIKRVLLGHWVFCVIAWSCISPHPFLNSLSLFLLTLSYWCVYEIGYQENDKVGEQYERHPTLSEAYHQKKYTVNLKTPLPWLYSLAFALPGCILFAISQSELPLTAAATQLYSLVDTPLSSASLMHYAWWLIYLLVIRVSFWLYNQFNEVTRIWIYPLLQAQRMFGFSILASTSVVGTILLVSFLVSRWIQYCVYRCGGERRAFPVNVSCLLLFVLLYISLAISTSDLAMLTTWQAAIAFTYCVLRSLKKLRQLMPQLRFIAK